MPDLEGESWTNSFELGGRPGTAPTQSGGALGHDVRTCGIFEVSSIRIDRKRKLREVHEGFISTVLFTLTGLTSNEVHYFVHHYRRRNSGLVVEKR